MSTSSPWPNGRSGCVSLSFDDGHPSQLSTAIPALERHDLRGTFYVNPRDDYVEWLKPWRDVHARGHEIGNHTVQHICSRNFGWHGGGGLEEATLAEIEVDILTCAARLHEGIPEQEECTFCYPCYQCFVGEGATQESYVPVVARHFKAGRGRGERANQPGLVDLHYLWSTPCERMSGAQMIGLVEQAVSAGQWAILTFHGVGSGHLSVSEGDFAELCAHLGQHRERIWTAPVIGATNTVLDWRASSASG